MILFCEICFRRPECVGYLFVSSCRHMFCRRCANSVTNCTVCKIPCRIIELRKDALPEAIKDYFIPEQDLLSKVVKVTKFQLEKQDAFIANKISVLDKYAAKKEKIRQLKEHYESLKKAINEEMTIISKMRQPGMLNNAPTEPVSMSSQSVSLRISTLKKMTPTTAAQQASKRTRISRSSSGSSGIGTVNGTPCHASSSQVPSSSKRISPSPRPRTGFTSNERKSKPIISPIESFKKPADLVSSARPGIYREAMRNISKAMERPNQPVLKFSNRGNDIERARNVIF
ncbi:zip homologous protein 2-like [Malaya genurostris]|uniref:zip homologous protein 2-like n=1 Tax=Malaya genurostris TaxID=325434 RepID=UPI0026F397C0|nr:zip homologous protein 2-like [Malaya genurostris]